MNTDKMYMVLRLNTKISVTDILGNESNITLSGCAGFCPVYATLEEAEAESENGKYIIMPITATNPA